VTDVVTVTVPPGGPRDRWAIELIAGLQFVPFTVDTGSLTVWLARENSMPEGYSAGIGAEASDGLVLSGDVWLVYNLSGAPQAVTFRLFEPLPTPIAAILRHVWVPEDAHHDQAVLVDLDH